MSSSGTSSSDLAALYVSDLHPDVTEGMLYEKFCKAGPVHSIRVCHDVTTQKSLGCAYVNFQKLADAELAFVTMNNDPIKGQRIKIIWSQRAEVGKIFVKNIDKAITDEALNDCFSAFGNVLHCKVSSNENGSNGYGFVQFETQESAETAIKCVNGMLLNDKQIFVGKFLDKPDRMKKMEEQGQSFTNVFIKNFGDKLDEEKLRTMFEEYGVIKSVAVMEDEDGNSKGFGFVSFQKHEEAQKAVESLNGTEVEGQVLYVGRMQKKQERQAELRNLAEQQQQERAKLNHGLNLYVKNLDTNVTEDELRKAFSQYGTITSVKIMDDGKRSRGFGFVCFSTTEEATKAMTKMNGRKIGSKALYVAFAQRREERKAHLTAQYMQKMSSNLGMKTATPTQMLGQSFQTARAPGGYLFPFQGGAQRMQQMHVHPLLGVPFRPPPFPIGNIRGVGPLGPNSSASWQMTVPVAGMHPDPHLMMQNQVAAMQYNQNVGNAAAIARYQQPGPLTASMLDAAPLHLRKLMLGGRLFTLINSSHPDLASRITDMLLEIDNSKLLHMLESPESLKEKVEEVVAVLQARQAKVVAEPAAQVPAADGVAQAPNTKLRKQKSKIFKCDKDVAEYIEKHLSSKLPEVNLVSSGVKIVGGKVEVETGVKMLMEEDFFKNDINFRAAKLSQYFSSRKEWNKIRSSLEDEYECSVTTYLNKIGSRADSDAMVGISSSKIQYKVFQGDIAEEKADAIVTGVSSGFDLGWGKISPAVLKKAGKALQDECSSNPLVSTSSLRVTKGYNLACKYVFHLVTPNSADELTTRVKSALEEAHKLGITSISFPTLGAGGIGIDALQVALAMSEAFEDFSEEKQLGCSLKNINIVVFEHSLLSVFQQHAVPDENTPSVSEDSTVIQTFCSDEEEWRATVTSSSQANNDKVIVELEELKSQIIVTEEIVDDNVAKFEENEMYEIEQAADDYGARVEIHKTPKLTIIGLSENVELVKEKVQYLLHDLVEALVVAKVCVWKMESSSGNFETFPLRVSRVIATNYEKSSTSQFDVNICGKKYVIDLAHMTYSSRIKSGKILREALNTSPGTSLPTEWAPMNGELMKRVTLTPASSEYGEVLKLFSKGNPSVSVQKIERIQNPYLYRLYQVKKQDVEKHMQKKEPASRELFHGTSRDDIDAICSDGFDRGFAGKHATMFGKGVYFAVDSSYSLNYCDRSGSKCMFLALVLTGNYCRGNSSFKCPPPMGFGATVRKYDSVVDNVSSPRIFVVFKDSSAYPKYLITFQ